MIRLLPTGWQPQVCLASRTLNRIEIECKPAKKVIWLLRPITHPLARIAAAAVIIYTLAPLTDLKIAAPLGASIEEKILGARAAERIEEIVDVLLINYGDSSYPQSYLDAFMGDPRPLSVRYNRLHTSKPAVTDPELKRYKI